MTTTMTDRPMSNIDALAERLLKGPFYHQLDGVTVALLDNDDPRKRAEGVAQAEEFLQERRAQREAEEAEAARMFAANLRLASEATRMARLWDAHRTARMRYNLIGLFTTLCVLFDEYVSDEKRDQVMALIRAYEDGFRDSYAVETWIRQTLRELAKLEARRDKVEARRAAKAKRAKGVPAVQEPTWEQKQKGLTKTHADSDYVRSRIQGGRPQRGVTQKIKRNDGRKVR